MQRRLMPPIFPMTQHNESQQPVFASVEDAAAALAAGGYLPPHPLAVSVFLAANMRRPLLLEGEAGVGKTAVALALAAALNRPLTRLQCYEGIDYAAAVYDWNYPRQLLAARLHAERGEVADLFGEEFLLRRPLLQTLSADESVLLIDEIDRADEPFEAFLLEFLSEWQVSIPEFGVIKTATPPLTILTSNRSREIHDALRRRCLYYWVDFPSPQREAEILSLHHPQLGEALTQQIVAFVRQLRTLDLYKLPGIAETADWAQALTRLAGDSISAQTADETLGALLKYRDDLERTRQHGIGKLLDATWEGDDAAQ